jgi:dihydroxy-acid dehydratase
LITDGRFSGSTRGPCIGHISPEAAEGGLLALVKDGDIIEINLNIGLLQLNVPEEELENRRKEWTYRPKDLSGVLKSYKRNLEDKSPAI